LLVNEIRNATKPAHQELDHHVYPLIQQVRNTDSYIKLLQSFYGYFKPVYGLLNLYLSNNEVTDFDKRRKPEAILNDIKHFSTEQSEIELCSDVPVISNISQGLGAFYVLEGSTMGGQIISKKIADNLGLASNEALSFFNGYGDDNKEMWNKFLISLDGQSAELNVEEVIFTADKTFTKFKNWIIYCYANKPTSVC